MNSSSSEEDISKLDEQSLEDYNTRALNYFRSFKHKESDLKFEYFVDEDISFNLKISPNTTESFLALNRADIQGAAANRFEPQVGRQVRRRLFGKPYSVPENTKAKRGSLKQTAAKNIKKKYSKINSRKPVVVKYRALINNNKENMADLEALDRIETELRNARQEADAHRHSSLAPAPYAGELDDDFVIFLAKLNLYFDSLHLTPEQRLEKFPLFLKSQAFEDFQGAPEGVRNTYENCTEWFKASQGSDEKKWVWRRLLQKRRLQPNESITKYYKEITKLTRKLNMDAGSAVAAFINGLPKEVAGVVAPQRPATLQSALQIACLFMETGGSTEAPEKKESDTKNDLMMQMMVKLLEYKNKPEHIVEKSPVTDFSKVLEALSKLDGKIEAGQSKPAMNVEKDSNSADISKILERLEKMDLKFEKSKAKHVKSVQPMDCDRNDDPPVWFMNHVAALQPATYQPQATYQPPAYNRQTMRPPVPPSGVTCQMCHRPGHVASTCFSLVRMRQNNQGPPQNNGYGYQGPQNRYQGPNGQPRPQDPRICYTCNRAGHISRFCNQNNRNGQPPRPQVAQGSMPGNNNAKN